MNRRFLPLWLAFGALLLGVTAWRILAIDRAPDIDQRFIEYTFDPAAWPHFDRGVSSDLLVGLYNRLDAYDPATSDAHVRTLAAALYLGAALLLFGAAPLRARPWVPFLCLGLLYTARFPFLWLSSELFAGAFLMMSLRAVLVGAPFWQVAVWLGLYGTARPDLVLPALAVGLFLAWQRGATWPERLRHAVVLGVPLLLLYLPGLIQYGAGFFEHSFYLRPEDKSESRAFYSLGQHYAALFYEHQLLPVEQRPSQWFEWKAWMARSFGPEADSVLDVIRAAPSKYLDFVFLSFGESVKNLLRAFAGLWLPLVVYAAWRLRGRVEVRVFLLHLVVLLPIAAVAYLHVRYMARFYPLLLFPLALWLVEEPRPRVRLVALLWLGAVLALQLLALRPVLLEGFWFVH